MVVDGYRLVMVKGGALEWSEKGFIYRGRKGYEFIKFGIRNQRKIGK